MSEIKNKNILNVIFLFSIFALLAAYFIEYVLGHHSCNLCLIERIPYGLSVALIITIFVFKKNEQFFVILLILAFIFSFVISIYHLGIEQGYFQESTVCGLKDLTENISKEDIINQLNENIISCKDVTFRIFGLSLTSINIVFSLIFTITLTKIYIRNEKN